MNINISRYNYAENFDISSSVREHDDDGKQKFLPIVEYIFPATFNYFFILIETQSGAKTSFKT